ncbi:MAG: 2Fe-2S iron-sulfur cluster-binding protein [Planctomycetota bacterium]
MPQVTYITPDGEQVTVEARRGDLMTLAVKHGVAGIEGNCGGVCACGTCHVQVDESWFEKAGPASDDELGVLEFEDSAGPTSRLSCQIKLTAELDGIVVRVVG